MKKYRVILFLLYLLAATAGLLFTSIAVLFSVSAVAADTPPSYEKPHITSLSKNSDGAEGLSSTMGLCTTDANHKTHCLKDTPKRIISLSPGATELLFAAGAGKQIVAVDRYSDYPEQAKQLPKVGGYPNTSIEAIVSFKPDLVVAWSSNSQKLLKQMATLGLNIFVINPRRMEDISTTITKLGVITGNQSTADKTANTFNQRLAQLKQNYQHLPPVSVFYDIWHEPIMTVGNNHIINHAISICGGQNVFVDSNLPVPTVSIESLIAKNPEVIIAATPQGMNEQSWQDLLKYWQQWSPLHAPRKKQMLLVASDLISRPTPRMLDGTELICRYLQTIRNQRTR